MNDRVREDERPNGQRWLSGRVAGWTSDLLIIGSVVGILATLVFVLIDLVLVRIVGLRFGAAWEHSAALFLNVGLIHTTLGRLIGYTAEFMLGSAFGISTGYLLRFTGKDNYLFKGLVVAGFWWITNVGAITRLFRVGTWVSGEPLTVLMALKDYIILGIISSSILAKYAYVEVEKARRRRVAATEVTDELALGHHLSSFREAFAEFSGELGELNDRLDQTLKHFDGRLAVEQDEDAWEKVEHLGFRVIAKSGDAEKRSEHDEE